jgi:hypothetical protein
MRIIARAGWGARAPKSTPTRVAIGSRSATCVHHDGPNPITVRSFAEACALVRRDQNFHMDGNGWADIGYNYLVINAPGADVDGMIFEGRGRDVVGAHCANHNTGWIGIQVALGGGQTPSPAALRSVRWLHDTCQSAAGHTLAKKVHSDGFPTACPDPKLRAWVKAGMPVTNTPTTTEVDMPLTTTDLDSIVERVLGAPIGRTGLTLAQCIDRAASPAPAPVDVAALAKAVLAGLPADGLNITAADLAKAVNDDAAARLAK